MDSGGTGTSAIDTDRPSPILSTTANNPMRIAFAALIAILGANLLIDLLDSNMVQMMEDRKATIERLMNN